MENNFATPQTQATELATQDEFTNAIMLRDIEPHFRNLLCISKTAKDCRNTLNMDREWQWHLTPTYIPEVYTLE